MNKQFVNIPELSTMITDQTREIVEARQQDLRQKLVGLIKAAKDTYAFTDLHKMIFWDHEIQSYVTIDRDAYWNGRTANYNLLDLAYSTATGDRIDTGEGVNIDATESAA